MNKKLYIFMSVLAATTLASTLKAEAKGCCCPSPTPSMKPRVYLDVGVGHAFDSHVGSDKFLGITDDGPILSSLSAKNHASPNNLAIGTGFLWPQPYQANSPYFPFLSLGLQYQYTNFDNKKTSMSLNSVFQEPPQEQIPFDDFNYVFSQNSLLANLKLDLYRWGRVMPYVNLGLGASWNQAKDKSPATFTDENQLQDITSATARSTSFSYTVGAGLDFLMSERFWLSLGYSYNNFGGISINQFSDTQDNDPSKTAPLNFIKFNNLGNLTTHNIQLTGRYVFG